jgi:hypothetical protein
LTSISLYGKFLERILQKEMNIMKQVAIKSSVLKRLAPTDKRVISLKGVLKNVDITEEDITSVKKSLYSKTGL